MRQKKREGRKVVFSAFFLRKIDVEEKSARQARERGKEGGPFPDQKEKGKENRIRGGRQEKNVSKGNHEALLPGHGKKKGDLLRRSGARKGERIPPGKKKKKR